MPSIEKLYLSMKGRLFEALALDQGETPESSVFFYGPDQPLTHVSGAAGYEERSGACLPRDGYPHDLSDGEARFHRGLDVKSPHPEGLRPDLPMLEQVEQTAVAMK